MDDATREAERAALAAPADAAVLIRLALARARSGDRPGAHAAALAALSVDPSAPVREYVLAPALPSMLHQSVASPATVLAPRPPFRFAPLAGPPLLEPLSGPLVEGAGLVVDVGRGLAAYASPDGLVAIDTFGGGVAWRGLRANPWGVHMGRLVASTPLEPGSGTTLLFLDPATGEEVAPAVRRQDLGFAADAFLSPLAIDGRTLAVLGTGRTPQDRVAFVGPDGIRSVAVPAPDAYRGVFTLRGVLAYQTSTTVGTSYLDQNMVVALADGQVAWTSADDLLGVVGERFALLAWPQTGPVVRLVQPDDGSVADEFPVRTEVSGGVHAFPDAVVSSSERRQFGLDRSWRQRWSWAPDGSDHDVRVRAFADLVVATIAVHEGLVSEPRRRALAILALDPRTGSIVWRQDLEPPVHMVADPVPVAGGLVLPTWRAPPVMVRAVGAVG